MKRGKNYNYNREKRVLRKKLVYSAGIRVSSLVLWQTGYNTISLALTLGVRIPRSYQYLIDEIIEEKYGRRKFKFDV